MFWAPSFNALMVRLSSQVLSAAYGLACAAWDFFMTFVSLFLMITLYVLLLRYIFGVRPF